MSELLNIQNLSKKFGCNDALNDVSLSIEGGKIYGLLGPNGSGKTTLIKIINGLLVPNNGTVLVAGKQPGPYTKSVISYLPDKLYFNKWMKVSELLEYYADFYSDFDIARAKDMLERLHISENEKLKSLSKGTKEKVQLILVMARRAKLYILDEPIGGVDPAARDYILETILSNYDPEASIIISTHLIRDIENILDDVIFLQNGKVVMTSSVDDIRQEKGMSVDDLFREVFRC